MPKINFVSAAGVTQTIEIPTGWTLMEGAIQNGVDGITAECGGGCACATCHVLVPAAWAEKLPPMTLAENDLLECTAVPRSPQSRLSCQIAVTGAMEGLTVHLPERQT